jgi:hypothetical protein
VPEPEDSLDEAIDGLYATDLDEFVARREALARELRGAGDRDAAAQVKQLRKPSRVAWAVNQAVRREPKRLDAVLRAGGVLREAQQRALREGAGGSLHDASRARQQAVHALANVAVGLLGPTGESARDAIEQTFNAASIDDDAANTVRAGRLVHELEPPDIFSTLEPGPRTPTPRAKARSASKPDRSPAVAKPAPPTRDARDDREARGARARNTREVEATARDARKEADKAQRELERAQTRAEDLAQRARDAADAAEDARRSARDAITRARDARQRAERAEERARAARASAGRDR